MSKVTIDLPIKTVAGLNAREHWRKRAARVKRERFTARVAVMSEPTVPLPCVVTMTRLSAGELDSDNLQGALKAVRDGIADAYGIPDNDPRLIWRYGQAKCPRGRHAVVVDLEFINDYVEAA